MNKIFSISILKEFTDIGILAEQIIKDKWIDSDTIIVNCSPYYSSITCQALNHNLSQINGNQLFEQLILDVPYPNMNQVWDSQSCEYLLFDKYLKDWVYRYVDKSYQYLFVNSATISGKTFTKIKNQLKGEINYRFASLYVQDNTIFTPDYSIEKFNFDQQGGIAFEWENLKNPNWNY